MKNMMKRTTASNTGSGPSDRDASSQDLVSPKFFDDRVVLDLALRVYPLEAVYGTCYVLTDRCWILLDHVRAGRILVQLKPRSNPGEPLEGLVADFTDELLRQALRLKIAKRTAAVRRMLVGRALLAAEPLTFGNEDDPDDYLSDPLGIAVPWEERFSEQDQGESPKGSEPGEPPTDGEAP